MYFVELEEARKLANPDLDQYFLFSPEKLALLVEAAGIQPTDDVVEVGAGIGSVARVLPPSASLTLVELDTRFSDLLSRNVPHATIMHGDALELLPQLPCDVLISNMPREPTERLLRILSELPSIRTAIIATGVAPDLAGVQTSFRTSVVTEISGDDFRPPQPAVSRLVCLSRRVAGR